MQKMIASGMKITASRHTRKAANIMIVKGNRALLKAAEIWRLNSP